MVKDIFDVNGRFYAFCSRLVDMVFLSILWYICCLSVILVIPASSALYYATVKSIIKDRGKAVKEYLGLFRQILRRDLAFSAVISLLTAADVIILLRLAGQPQRTQATLFCSLSLGLLLFVMGIILLWREIVGCKADGSPVKIFQVSYVLAIQYFPKSIAMVLLTAAALLAAYIFPPFLLILPSFCAKYISYLAETVLEKYYPSGDPEE